MSFELRRNWPGGLLALAITCSMIWAAYRVMDCHLSGWRDEI